MWFVCIAHQVDETVTVSGTFSTGTQSAIHVAVVATLSPASREPLAPRLPYSPHLSLLRVRTLRSSYCTTVAAVVSESILSPALIQMSHRSISRSAELLSTFSYTALF